MKQVLRIKFASRAMAGACCIYLATAMLPSVASALDLEGFAEPYRIVNVAADETGTIEEVFVHEGQMVEAGQPLVRLNSTVHEALLAIAEQNMHAEGRIEAAQADLSMRELRLEKLKALRMEGHARQEEVDRANGEVAIALANVRTAQEDQATRRLEYEKIKAQLDRRTVHAPISGALTTIQKVAGEFVAPNNPDVVTLVQIDKLLANFTLMSAQMQQLKEGQQVAVHFQGVQAPAMGTVEFISPVTDAESGTVLVKIRIENAQGQFRSGQRCSIHVEN